MKHAAYGLLAAFLAQGVYGAIPTTAEGWYRPENGFKTTDRSGDVAFLDEDGIWSFFSISVNADGKIVYNDSDFDDLGMARPAFEAMVKALQAQTIALQNTERIETIGENLDSIFNTDGIEMEMEKQGPGGSTSKAKYTLKVKPGGGGSGATIKATDPIPYGNVVDGKTIGWTENNAAGQLQMNGAKTATASTDDWWFDYGFFVPFLKGNNSLGWKRYGGWYSGVFDTMNDGGRTMLTLAGWTGGKECGTDLKSIMTEESGDNRANHYVLTRYGTGSSAVFHYVPFGGRLDAGCEADSYSIKTNDSGKLTLTGFDEAKPEDASDGATIPFVDATSDDLQWAGIENFFSESVFRKSSTTGKMLLNGTSESDKVKVLTMTGNGDPDDQHVSALAFDGRSVDASSGVVQVSNFDTAPSPFAAGETFTDALTNMNISVANMSVPLRVPVQSGGYEVKYAPLAKITGIPAAPVDDITIELNETDPLNPYLQLHGAAGEGITLETGDVYMIGNDGKGMFGKFGADGDDSDVVSGLNSLESYTNTDGERFFRLKDWDTNYETPRVLGKDDGALKYYDVNGGGGVETHSSGAGDQLQLSGYDTAANGALPYKVNDGNGISWLAGVDDRVPLLHNGGAPTTMAIGGSLDKANMSAVPTLNVSGFTAGGNCSAKLNTMLSDPNDGSNRSAHQLMARYSSGGSTPTVHWVSIDDVIAGGGSPVDDASITTNTANGAVTAGTASIYGFSNASSGDFATKGSGNNIQWKSIVGGLGIKITESGNTKTISLDYDDTAGEYSVLSFVSDVVWDGTSKQLKVQKTTCLARVLSVSTESQEVVFTASSHAAEHPEP